MKWASVSYKLPLGRLHDDHIKRLDGSRVENEDTKGIKSVYSNKMKHVA